MTRRRTTSRGAAAVETALLLPVLALLFFGTVEYGFAWSSASRVESAGAAAARVAAQAGDESMADWEVLQAVRGSVAVLIVAGSSVACSAPGPVKASPTTSLAAKVGPPMQPYASNVQPDYPPPPCGRG